MYAHMYIICTLHTSCNFVYRPAMWSEAGLVTNHSRAGGVVTCTVHHLTGFAVLVSTAQVSAGVLVTSHSIVLCCCLHFVMGIL